MSILKIANWNPRAAGGDRDQEKLQGAPLCFEPVWVEKKYKLNLQAALMGFTKMNR